MLTLPAEKLHRQAFQLFTVFNGKQNKIEQGINAHWMTEQPVTAVNF